MVKKLDKCIETERLLLLPLGIRFLESTHAYASDIENTILLEDKHIGAVSLSREEENVWELGWILNKLYWRQGYTLEAAKALMEYANMKLGVTKFCAHCDTENIGSYRVMEALGMRRVSQTFGRKNKSSEELRGEYRYEG